MRTLSRRSAICLFVLIALSSTATEVRAQRELKDIPAPDPELERATFQLAEGFEVNLFAADPLLAKPIQMNFDSRGRLWVASSEVYPQIEPGQLANDKIVILEDADGDGIAENSSVYADGLLIPTGVEPGDGGAYVANSTELVHLADTDGDGRADKRRVCLSGFGTEDTHHILHTLRWGPEGLLYFNQSVYIHSHVETPHGVRRLLAGGIWSYRPETEELEVFCRGFVNPWGHQFDAWGQSFATDGAYGEGINHVFPGAVFVKAEGATRILAGLNPGSPKHCGLEIVDGRHLPDDWRGNALTNDFRAHRVCRFILGEDTSGFTSREQVEIIKSTHAAFRPIDVKMGPDGAIYIADWYNPIIQHGEVDFRDSRRDHVHGRIWRVTAKGRPLVERPRLASATVEELLDYLKAPESWTRRHARQVLKERANSVAFGRVESSRDSAAKVGDALEAWLSELDPTDPNFERHRLEGLWTYQALLDEYEVDLAVGDEKQADATSTSPRRGISENGLLLLAATLESPEPKVRAAATRVLYHWSLKATNTLDLAAKLAQDDDPQTRLEATRVLSRIPSLEAAAAALRALDKPQTADLDFALWLTARELQEFWLPDVRAGTPVFGDPSAAGAAARLEFALRAVDSSEVVPPLLALLDAGRIPPERLDSALALVAGKGNATELGGAIDMALSEDHSSEGRAALLGALAAASRERGLAPEANLERLLDLLSSKSPSLVAAAARAAGVWKFEAARPRLIALASDPAIDNATRRGVLEGLTSLGGEGARAALVELTKSENPLNTRVLAIVALVPLDLDTAAQLAAIVLSEAEIGQEAGELMTAFVGRAEGPQTLVRAITGHVMTADAAKAALRAARGAPAVNEELIAALRTAGGLTSTSRPLTPEEIAELVRDTRSQGDPDRGEAVFRRAELACLDCHAIAGAGGLVGPDLASIGASAPVDYLIDSIQSPNKAVKENYHSLVVTTSDGEIVTGVKLRETIEELVLRNSKDQEISIAKSKIEETGQGISLMPAGLAENLTRRDLVDLTRFLSELGKVGKFAVGSARPARRWRVLSPTPEGIHRVNRTRLGTAATDDPELTWIAAYSNVAGDLPLDDVPRFQYRAAGPAYKIIRAEFTAQGAGIARVRFDSAAGQSVWLDERPLESATEMAFEVEPGPRRLTIAIEADADRSILRLEPLEGPEPAVEIRFLGGK